MPYLAMTFSHEPYEAVREKLMSEASRLVANTLGKLESYVCVSVREASMIFGGQGGPTVFIELRSIGCLDPNRNIELSRKLCALLLAEVDIPSERVYINFIDIAGSYWGWNSGTFG